jgi:hypothetical protein
VRTFLELIKPYRKAILAGVVAAIFTALPLVTDGDITGAEIGVIVTAGLTGAGVTYRVPNVPAPTGQRKAG